MKNTDNTLEGNINYKKIFQKLFSYKKVYFIFIIICLIAAFAVNKFTVPKYKNYSIIRINENSSSLLNSSNDFMQGLRVFESNNNIEDEIEIISSFTLVKKVINNLDLKASYFTFKNTVANNFFFNTPVCNKTELYKYTPIKVVIDPSVAQATYLNFKIHILNENEFLLETTGTDIYLYNYIDDEIVSFVPSIYYKNRYEFGSEIKTQYFNFRVIKTDYFNANYTKENNLYFYFNNINWLTSEYQQNLSSEPASQLSTLLKVTLKGTDKDRITDFLNVLMSSYMQRNLENKNRIALSTVDFIDSQISDIADSLSYAETRLRNFRTSHSVLDLSFQGQQIFEKLSELETEKANLQQQRRYYSYLKNYLDNTSDVSNLLSPSSMNVVDPILTNFITQLITFHSERVRLVKNMSNTENLYLADVNLKIENIKKTIKENVYNTLNTLNVSLNEINYRISSLSSQISQMPKTELQLKGIERKFKLNDAIYTFLLQKRSEAQIARASSMPDYDIIDPARISVTGLVSPKKNLNYIIAFFLGLFLPTSIIMLRDFLNNKITEIEEIESASKFPIIGKVFHSFRRTSMVVNDYPNSV